MGPRVAQFEREFAEAVGVRHAVMVNSGSSANLAAVAALVLNPNVPLEAGDEVLVPAVSWSTTYYPFHQYGLKLVFVDIDPETLNIDLEKAREAITSKTRAIAIVNLLGNPLDYTQVENFADEFNLVVVEDNCEALGASFEGRQSGTLGLVGTYSSFFSHHISTMEGGLAVTNDQVTYEHLVSVRAHGWVRDLPHESSLLTKSGDSFEDSFRFVLPGYNLRPLEMSGALGTAQLKKVPNIVEGRRENARFWVERMAGVDGVRIQRETGVSSWFGFSMVLEGRLAERRPDALRALHDAQVDVRPIVAGNFTRNPVITKLDASIPMALPVADEIHDRGLFIGNHHYDVTDKLDQVASLIESL